jgi:hypothetical protein
MSEFRFACPHCGQRIAGDPGYKGTQITCPACQRTLTVPDPAARAKIGEAIPPTASAAKTSHLAIVSLVCSVALGAGSIPGIVFGHLARARIRRNPSLKGKSLATAGLVISYFFLLASVAFLTVGFFVLAPKQGRQLTAKQTEANTPEIMAARRVDEVKIGDPSSESAHGLKSRLSRGNGEFNGRRVRDAVSGGVFSYVMKVDPAKPMSLYCTYWGNDTSPRRFDILVNDAVIATQTLDFNDPGHFFDVEYRIPEKLTLGQSNVTVVFQADPGKFAGGLFACQTLGR